MWLMAVASANGSDLFAAAQLRAPRSIRSLNVACACIIASLSKSTKPQKPSKSRKPTHLPPSRDPHNPRSLIRPPDPQHLRPAFQYDKILQPRRHTRQPRLVNV